MSALGLDGHVEVHGSEDVVSTRVLATFFHQKC
jgi:hypothetical protein